MLILLQQADDLRKLLVAEFGEARSARLVDPITNAVHEAVERLEGLRQR